MDLSQIIKAIQHPEDALDPKTFEDMIDWCTMWIYNIEEEIADLDFRLDTELDKMLQTEERVNRATAKLKLTDDWRSRAKKERTLRALKSYRSNIKKKRDRLTSNF